MVYMDARPCSRARSRDCAERTGLIGPPVEVDQYENGESDSKPQPLKVNTQTLTVNTPNPHGKPTASSRPAVSHRGSPMPRRGMHYPSLGNTVRHGRYSRDDMCIG